MVTANKNL